MSPSWKRSNLKRILQSLSLPETGGFDVAGLVGAVRRQRCRPLTIEQYPFVPGITSLWVRTPTEDRLIIAEGLPPLQWEQAVLHDVAHMLCGHTPHVVTVQAALQAALGVPEQMTAMARSSYRHGDGQEREAEALATALCVLLHRESCGEGDERAARFWGQLS